MVVNNSQFDVENLIKLSQNFCFDDAIDIVIDYFDDLLISGDYAGCDIGLRLFQEDVLLKLDVAIIISILSVTLAAKNDLLERSLFYERSYRVVRKKHGFWRARSLLKDFR